MGNIKFRSSMGVTLVQSNASDTMVTQAAKVSTQGADAAEASAAGGLINYLMRDRHGSPFEHMSMTWLISAPIFVWREMMRHRIASYNEESGRYKQLDPVFYIPSDDRNLVQQGKPGAYEYVPGSLEQVQKVRRVMMTAAEEAYGDYEDLLNAGIAREVARMVLPVNIYSSAFVTMNPRALMNYLSLRTKHPESTFPSFPQREIEMVAEQMEQAFAMAMPLTYEAWVKNGRVAP
jgi:thymidylate synthase (FAD)